jgi:hypothetical protein
VREREDLDERVRLARERLAALEQSLAERGSCRRPLAEQGEQLVLQPSRSMRGASGQLRRRSAIARPRCLLPTLSAAST